MSALQIYGDFARQRVIHSAGEDFGTERQLELEDAVADVIEIPAGLVEETMNER